MTRPMSLVRTDVYRLQLRRDAAADHWRLLQDPPDGLVDAYLEWTIREGVEPGWSAMRDFLRDHPAERPH